LGKPSGLAGVFANSLAYSTEALVVRCGNARRDRLGDRGVATARAMPIPWYGVRYSLEWVMDPARDGCAIERSARKPLELGKKSNPRGASCLDHRRVTNPR